MSRSEGSFQLSRLVRGRCVAVCSLTILESGGDCLAALNCARVLSGAMTMNSSCAVQ